MNRLVWLRCRFDSLMWRLVRRWFHFEIDSEFLRGVAFGMKAFPADRVSVTPSEGNGTSASGYYRRLDVGNETPPEAR